MKLLIIYGTTEGQTRKISTYLCQEARKRGHTVSLQDATAAILSPFGFDAVIVAASIHNGRYHSSIEHYVTDQAKLLNHEISVLLSVSLTAAGTEPNLWVELKENTQTLLDRSDWTPNFVEYVAGAIQYSKYNYFKKVMINSLAKHYREQEAGITDQEYTDWDQVEGILDKVERAYHSISSGVASQT